MQKFLAALCLFGCAAAARGDSITFSTPTIVLIESPSVQTGFFDILISNSADSNTSGGAGDTLATSAEGYGPGVTNTNGSDLVADFAAEVVTSGAVTFIATDDNTSAGAVNAATYLYAADADIDPHGLVNDQDAYLFGYPNDDGMIVSAGTPLGLLRVEYSIPANVTGVFPLTVINAITDPGYGSTWADSNYDTNIPLLVSGSISVVPTPEPGSLAMLVLGAFGLAGMRVRRARRSPRDKIV